MMPITRSENTDTSQPSDDPPSSRRGTRTLALAGCSLAAAAVAGEAAAPAAASSLSATPEFVRAGDHAPVPSPDLLGSGDTGPAVKQLQRSLHIPVNGVFGDATRRAVARFQRDHHLGADGVVGPATRRALHLRVRIIGSPATGAATASSSSATGGYSIPTSIVMCESGGNYSAVNPSSEAGGAYQILPSTWAAYGGTGLPQNAPPAEQNAIAAKIYATAGRGQWSC